MEGNGVRLCPKAALFSRGIRVVRHPAFRRPHRNKGTISNRFQKRVKTKGDTMTRKLIMLTGTLLLGGCVAMAQAGAGAGAGAGSGSGAGASAGQSTGSSTGRWDRRQDQPPVRWVRRRRQPQEQPALRGPRPRLLRARLREAPQPIPIAPCPVQVRLSRVPRPPRPPEQPLPQRQAQYRHPAPIRT